uniref:Uncharacterized protein n=1 Tax=Tanacetum cinerariifolium TaxID=118510 RepID=A0A699H8E4_TANCI|nr:hypothetical protein [Tanacetum cinerariifolium]
MATRRSFQLPRLCKCRNPLVRRTAWTVFNSCRRFLNCRNSNVTRKKSCDAFYKIDPELNNGWYKNQMIELYLALTHDERYLYMEHIRAQDRYEMLEAEYEVYQAEMELKLVEAEKSKSFGKRWLLS